ncbi:MAG: ATP-binding cassette domain-containing protein [Subdoligranulum variabile]|nr:ATP-binding cassette domain-containing protein [Subdoligranulum variabile]
MNLDFPRGSFTALVGESGCGKSTIAAVLTGRAAGYTGSVTIGGRELSTVKESALLQNVTLVSLGSYLFKGTVADNLRIANRNATHEQVVEACKKASIHDFIMTLPQGYDTPVGELGSTLSGGERQRLGVARAFLHDAPYILLDEPTSNLDSLNEAVILKSLAEERRDKTVVLVSHRASTMRIADRTYSVENGRMS